MRSHLKKCTLPPTLNLKSKHLADEVALPPEDAVIAIWDSHVVAIPPEDPILPEDPLIAIWVCSEDWVSEIPIDVIADWIIENPIDVMADWVSENPIEFMDICEGCVPRFACIGGDRRKMGAKLKSSDAPQLKCWFFKYFSVDFASKSVWKLSPCLPMCRGHCQTLVY